MRANFVMSGVAAGMRRNMTMTIALVLNTAISLAFLGAAILANREIDNFRNDYQNKLNVSIFLCGQIVSQQCTHPISDVERNALESKMRADPQITSFSYLSQEAAYERGKKVLDPDVLPHIAVSDFPASYVLKLHNIQRDYDVVAQRYGTSPGVDKVYNIDESLRVLLKSLDGVRLAFLIVAFIVLVCAVLVMSNTIQVAAQQRRSETNIMRLVGASRWMTELPFMIEAVIATILGGIVAIAFDWFGKHYVLDGLFNTQVHRGIIPNLDTNDVLVAGGGVLLASVVLAAITAFATLRLYVRL
jgi:cell division transport system permease protein